MLRYVPRILTAELLELLLELRQGQTVVLADSMFPAKMPNGPPVVEFGGDNIGELLKVLFGFLSIYSPAIMMKPDEGEGKGNPAVKKKYAKIIKNKRKKFKIERVGRQEFYKRAKGAAFIIRTRDCTPWANIILARGVLQAQSMSSFLPPRCLKELHLLGHGQGIVICENGSLKRLSLCNIPFIRVEGSLPRVLDAVLRYVPPDTFPGNQSLIPIEEGEALSMPKVGALQECISTQWPKAPHLRSVKADVFGGRARAAALVIVATGKDEGYPPVVLFKGNKTKL